MNTQPSLQTNRKPISLSYQDKPLVDFWELSADNRLEILLNAIIQSHTDHYTRNAAYRLAMNARNIGPQISTREIGRLPRTTSILFKSYIDALGSPFPQDNPTGFIAWLQDQISITLPKERFSLFRKSYPSIEALLSDFERIFADLGFEILTSSGTSGRVSIMLRNQRGIQRTVESFYLAFQRYLGMQADHRAIFIMPQQTRIAMVRMASFSVKRIGLPSDHIHFTIPFPASPDHVRIRSGRTYRMDWRGWAERKLWNPLMNWANDALVTPYAIQKTIDLLKQAEARQEKVLVFGSWMHLHGIALFLKSTSQKLSLAPGSLFGTGGGFKEIYPYTIEEIQLDISREIQYPDGQPVILRDVYGMAEGNWAAMQCKEGNYHIPPWILAYTLDENDNIQEKMDSKGLLAFFDPYGGGDLFPAFFKTADQVHLMNDIISGAETCPCGDSGAYIARSSIQRVDLLDEAGCAAQI